MIRSLETNSARGAEVWELALVGWAWTIPHCRAWDSRLFVQLFSNSGLTQCNRWTVLLRCWS